MKKLLLFLLLPIILTAQDRLVRYAEMGSAISDSLNARLSSLGDSVAVKALIAKPHYQIFKGRVMN